MKCSVTNRSVKLGTPFAPPSAVTLASTPPNNNGRCFRCDYCANQLQSEIASLAKDVGFN